MSHADRLAILAFEAALDRNRWLWAELCCLEQATQSVLDRRHDAILEVDVGIGRIANRAEDPLLVGVPGGQRPIDIPRPAP